MFEKYSFWMTENQEENGTFFVSIEIFQEEGCKSLKITKMYLKEEVFKLFEEFEHLFTEEEKDEIFSEILDLEIPTGRDHDHNVDRTHKTK